MMGRHISCALLCALIIATLPGAAASAGIAMPPLSERTFVFEPNAKYEFSWKIHGSTSLESFLSGDLEQYGTLVDPAQNTSERTVTFRVQLPSALEPGRHVLYLNARESGPEATMGGRASAGAGILVISLYPTPYADAELSVLDVSVGNATAATINLKSWSKADAKDVFADIQVTDSNGTVLLTTQTQHVALPSQGSATLSARLRSESFSAGRYTVTAKIHGLQPDLQRTSDFRIGTFDVALASYTQKLGSQGINRFSFTVESNWNEQIKGVSGFVKLAGMDDLTATTVLPPFGQATLNAYLDSSLLNLSIPPEGVAVPGVLTINYLDTRGAALAKDFPISVTISPQALPETVATPREVQQAKGGFALSGTMLLYLGLLVLVMINVVVLFFYKRKRDGPAGGIEPPKVV